jgi:glycosyltransferase involved in cell wall biosynthesis
MSATKVEPVPAAVEPSSPVPIEVAFHIDQLWFSSPGGIGTYVWELGSALMRRHDVRLRTFRTRWSDDPPRVWMQRPEDAVIMPYPSRLAYAGWATVRRPRLPRALSGAAIIHATNPATIPPPGDGQALVVTIHDLAFEHEPVAFPDRWLRLYRRGLSIARNEAAAILVPSSFVGRELRDRGIDDDRVHVVPLAGRPSPLPAPTLPAEAVVEGLGVPMPYVLSVGTLEPRKNLARLVHAYRDAVGAASLPHALVLAGHPGWRTGDLDAAIAEEGPGTVVRLERATDLELDALYRAADAVVYVSLSEGFGMPLLEAMSRGTPVVSSSATSMPEVAGDAAILVDPMDGETIARALVRVLEDPALADDLRRRGLARAAAFSWEATAAGTIDVYRRAVGRDPLEAG